MSKTTKDAETTPRVVGWRESIQESLVALVAELPGALPATADRRTMWDRIGSVLKASASSEASWGPFLEAMSQRLQLDLALFLARPEAARAISAGNTWTEADVREGLRQAGEETMLICALARLRWEEIKQAKAAAQAPPEAATRI